MDPEGRPTWTRNAETKDLVEADDDVGEEDEQEEVEQTN